MVALAALVLLMLRDSDGGPRTGDPDRDAPVGVAPPEDADMVGLDAGAGGRSVGARAEPASQSWRVRIRTTGDETPRSVRIRAEDLFGDATLEAEGEADWKSVAPGDWVLVVEAEGFPRWSRRVRIDPGEAEVTYVLLGQPFQVLGRVRDTSGQPCAKHFVGFIDADGVVPSDAVDWLHLPSTRTAADGTFRLDVLEAGTYRMFIGYGGSVRLADTERLEVVSGGIAEVDVVVRVPTRLVLTARDAGAVDGPLVRGSGYAVSVYRRKDILDLERPLPEVPDPVPVDLDDPTLDDDSRKELAAAVEAEKATLDPAELARRLAVVPEGWRVDRSAAFGPAGELTFTDLPSGEELRFAARRDREVFRVEGSVVVHPTAVTRAQLLWPAGELGDAPEPRSVELTSSVDSVDGAPLPVGATWTERR